jgi:hypothetical protein
MIDNASRDDANADSVGDSCDDYPDDANTDQADIDVGECGMLNVRREGMRQQ